MQPIAVPCRECNQGNRRVPRALGSNDEPLASLELTEDKKAWTGADRAGSAHIGADRDPFHRRQRRAGRPGRRTMSELEFVALVLAAIGPLLALAKLTGVPQIFLLAGAGSYAGIWVTA